ncbi:MAG TPA: PQQ-binding-like beta-propeller repeat protein [Vicinamibacterales bacterium]|nr:PQQ-binding-like beta-propeller repeat protein [Vicinamibacterales bacterium]
MKHVVGTGLVAVATAATLSAENWPQWRGPAKNGVSTERGLPLKWSTTENITWKLAMPGRSGSTPIIWGETIFLNIGTADRSGDLELWALDRADGRIRWKKHIAGGNHVERKQNMSSPSPVTDGQTVWVMTGVGILKAFDFTGKELWMRDIQKDYGRFGLNWGYASSPLLYDGDLFVQVLHGMKTDDPSYLLRVEGKSGKTLWRTERPTRAIEESPDSYTTPAVLQAGKAPNSVEIVVTGGDVVTGHDPGSGKELWRMDGLNPTNNPSNRIIASPVTSGDIVIAPTRERPMLAIKGGGRGDVTRTHRLWSFDNGPDVPTPVSDGKLLYTITDRGVAYALELATGKVVYGPQRLRPDSYSASPVLADERIYVTSENEGLTSVYRAGPKFELLAENPLDDYCLSSPAISEGQIFIRTTGHLWAIGQRKKGS